MSSKRASREEDALDLERLRSLIGHIHQQAEALQGDARGLPDGVAKSLGKKAEDLLQTADALLDEVEGLESNGLEGHCRRTRRPDTAPTPGDIVSFSADSARPHAR